MRARFFFAAIFVACILQVTAVNHLKIFGIKPDLILIGIVLMSLSCEWKVAVALSIMGGAFKDIYGSGAFVLNTILSPLWSILVINLARRFSIDINLTRAVLVFIIAVLNALAIALFLWYMETAVTFGIFMRITFLDSLYTALLSLLIFKVLRIR
jgi:rod shape-determining protein MreD